MNRRQPTQRRGVALIVVLLLVSMVMGLTYAAVRSQHTTHLLPRNGDRRSCARQAAVTGLTMALKKMHTDDWDGVDSTLTGSLGNDVSFEVTYTTGDPSLSAGDDDYDEYPFRVTLLATGMAADPANPQAVATHQIRGVVRLIPRALSAEPNEWDEMTGYTLFQTKSGAFYLTPPCRVEGAVRVQGGLELGSVYAWATGVRDRYVTDLNTMRLAGYDDWRPLDGPIDLPYGNQDAGLVDLLEVSMAVPTSDVPKEDVTDWKHPTTVATYQLYPGGETYSAEAIAQTQRNVTLQADPLTNPLGIFYRSGLLQLYENVTVHGTLVTLGGPLSDVQLSSGAIQLLPVDLPALEGADEPVQLPALASADDIVVQANVQLDVTGVVTAKDDFDIRSDDQEDISVTIAGRVMAKEVKIRGRRDWYQTESWWKDRYDEFVAQEEVEGGIVYFPVWLLAKYGLNPAPQLTIKPETTAVRYHWHNPDNPVYVPHNDDDGLRWELLDWTENP